MSELNKEIIKKCANNLMFELTDEECTTLVGEFEVLFAQMEELNKLEGIDEVEPMVFPFEVTTDFLREDIEGEPLKVEEVLANAKDVKEGQIKLPKVVG